MTARSSFLNRDLSFGYVPLAAKVTLAKNLSLMLKSGVPLPEALDVLAGTVDGYLKKVIQNVSRAVYAGTSLAEALAVYPRVFSSYFIGAVYAGEASGTLSDNLIQVAEELYKEKDMSAKVKGSLVYPAVILVAALALGLMIVLFILPKIVPMFTGLRIQLPLLTRLLIALANFLQLYGHWVALASVLLLVALVWLWRWHKSRPAFDSLLLSLPLAKGISRNLNLARFARVMATMLHSGVPIVDALAVAAKTLNNWHYAQAARNMQLSVGKGERLADGLAAHRYLFPEMMYRMIAIGEQSGRLEDTLYYLAANYEDELDKAAKNLATAIEPSLLLFIGLIVGLLALAIITPIYSLTGSIAR